MSSRKTTAIGSLYSIFCGSIITRTSLFLEHRFPVSQRSSIFEPGFDTQSSTLTNRSPRTCPSLHPESRWKPFRLFFSHRPGFSQEVVSVDFVTTAEFVKSVLPPPGLEPPSKPTGPVSISTWGEQTLEFECTLVSLQAVHDGVKGKYCLTLIVSGDTPVTWGREIWGEVKKTGGQPAL